MRLDKHGQAIACSPVLRGKTLRSYRDREARRRVVVALAGVHRATRAGGDRTLRRAAAADHCVRSTGDTIGQNTTREMISATKAGLSSPSISSVAVVTICNAPPDASSLWAGLFDLRDTLLGSTVDDLRALAA